MDTNGGFLVTKVKQLSERVFEKILNEKKIDAFNGAQGRILYVLWQKDGISIKTLSEQCGLAITSLTSMLERMEKQGLLRRESDEKDKRKTLLFLTDRAYALREDYEDVSPGWERSSMKASARKKSGCLSLFCIAFWIIWKEDKDHERLYQGSDPKYEPRDRLHGGLRLLLCPQ